MVLVITELEETADLTFTFLDSCTSNTFQKQSVSSAAPLTTVVPSGLIAKLMILKIN
jgi:hypothetical protein